MDRCPVCNAVLEITTDGRFCPNCHWHKRAMPAVEYTPATARAQAVKELVKAAREILPPEPEIQGWWCHSCLCFVSPEAVTHNERHELCGTPVTPVGEEPPKVKALRAALTRLDAVEKADG